MNLVESKLPSQGFCSSLSYKRQSRTIEEALLKSNIPYTMVGGTKFYSRKEIRDIIAYLNLIANLSDNISFERIINEPKRNWARYS